MDVRETDSTRCSVARTAALVADGWTVLVLRDLFNGLRRFDELVAHLGIARNVLTRRLAALDEAGLVQRVAYRADGSRERHEYRLTEAGYDLRPVLLALMAWGDRHLLADGEAPPAAVVHRDCGTPVHVEVRCAEGHPVTPGTRLRTVFDPAAARGQSG